MWHQLSSIAGVDDDHLVAQLGDRAVRFPGHEPARPLPRLRRLERERRVALVGDDHEQVGVAVGPQHELERLHRVAAGQRRVERRPAAGEEQARAGRETPVRRHLREPLGLRRDRASCLLAEHERQVYTIEGRWRRSNATCSTTACGS